MISVTVRKEWFVDPMTTVYEGENVFSALSAIRFEQVKGENKIITIHLPELRTVSIVNRPEPLNLTIMPSSESALIYLVLLLFVKPTQWEMDSAAAMMNDVAHIHGDIPQVYTNEAAQEDNRANEIIFKDGSFHIFAKEKPIEQVAEKQYGDKE